MAELYLSYNLVLQLAPNVDYCTVYAVSSDVYSSFMELSKWRDYTCDGFIYMCRTGIGREA